MTPFSHQRTHRHHLLLSARALRRVGRWRHVAGGVSIGSARRLRSFRTGPFIATFRCAAPARCRAFADERRIVAGDDGSAQNTAATSALQVPRYPFGFRAKQSWSSDLPRLEAGRRLHIQINGRIRMGSNDGRGTGSRDRTL